MAYDVNNVFSGMPTVENCATQAEQIASLQAQVTALKRDLEYTLYHLEFKNLSRRLQVRILNLEKGDA